MIVSPRTASISLAALIGVLAISSSLSADESQRKFGMGINASGVGVRYFFTPKFSLELKGQHESGVKVGGLRSYYYFPSQDRLCLFIGAEGDAVSFQGSDSKGTGTAGEVFGGGEYFFMEKLALQLDFGPAFIFLRDQSSAEHTSGLEFVVNAGLNYYFSWGQRR